jgi:hypothetical protein
LAVVAAAAVLAGVIIAGRNHHDRPNETLAAAGRASSHGVVSGSATAAFGAVASGSSAAASQALTAAVPPLALPRNPHAGTATTSGAELCWDPVTGATAYEVGYRRSTELANSIKKLTADQVCTTISTIEAVPPSTTVYAQVRACGPADCSDWTSKLTMESLPPVPANVRAGPATSSSVLVLWDDGPGETRYHVYFRAADVLKWSSKIIPANQTTATVDGLPPDTTVYVAVDACNDVGCSDASKYVTLQTLQ